MKIYSSPRHENNTCVSRFGHTFRMRYFNFTLRQIRSNFVCLTDAHLTLSNSIFIADKEFKFLLSLPDGGKEKSVNRCLINDHHLLEHE